MIITSNKSVSFAFCFAKIDQHIEQGTDTPQGTSVGEITTRSIFPAVASTKIKTAFPSSLDRIVDFPTSSLGSPPHPAILHTPDPESEQQRPCTQQGQDIPGTAAAVTGSRISFFTTSRVQVEVSTTTTASINAHALPCAPISYPPPASYLLPFN